MNQRSRSVGFTVPKFFLVHWWRNLIGLDELCLVVLFVPLQPTYRCRHSAASIPKLALSDLKEYVKSCSPRSGLMIIIPSCCPVGAHSPVYSGRCPQAIICPNIKMTILLPIFFPLALQPNSGLGRLHKTFRFTSVTRSRTVGRTPWTDDQLVARPLPVHKHRKTHKQLKP
jgi:hypothetical protein